MEKERLLIGRSFFQLKPIQLEILELNGGDKFILNILKTKT